MTNIIIYTRHGEYDRRQGDLGDLTDRGRAQIADIGTQLADDHHIIPVKIYHSDVMRTKSAAEILSPDFAARAGRAVAMEAAPCLADGETSRPWELLSGKMDGAIQFITHESHLRLAMIVLKRDRGMIDRDIMHGETFVFKKRDASADWKDRANIEVINLKPRT
jgi:phosphohistidine phosphatase SixA